MKQEMGGPGLDNLKYQFRKMRSKMKSKAQSKKVDRLNKKKGVINKTIGDVSVNRGSASDRKQDGIVGEVEKAKKVDTLKREAKKKIGKVGEMIKKKTSGMSDNMSERISKRRYEKGKGPKGTKATESGSATDEQVCGPDGKCKTKSPRGLGGRRN